MSAQQLFFQIPDIIGAKLKAINSILRKTCACRLFSNNFMQMKKNIFAFFGISDPRNITFEFVNYGREHLRQWAPCWLLVIALLQAIGTNTKNGKKPRFESKCFLFDLRSMLLLFAAGRETKLRQSPVRNLCTRVRRQ